MAEDDFNQSFDEAPAPPSTPFGSMMGGQAPLPEDAGPAPSEDPLYADAMQGLSPGQRTLEAEYHALHQGVAAHKLKEMGKFDKFQRAMNELAVTFGTIQGRPDIAKMAQARMDKQDTDRANLLQSQILAHVGLRALQQDRDNKQAMIAKNLGVMNTKSMNEAIKVANSAGFQYGDKTPIEQRNLMYLHESIRRKNAGEPPLPDFEWNIDQEKAKQDKLDLTQGRSDIKEGRDTREEAGKQKNREKNIHLAGGEARATKTTTPAAAPPKPEKATKPRPPVGGSLGKHFVSQLSNSGLTRKARISQLHAKADEMMTAAKAGAGGYTREDAGVVADQIRIEEAAQAEADAAAAAKPAR